MSRGKQGFSWLDRDLFLAFGACTVSFLVFRSLDLFEWAFEFTRQYESWELDEAVLVFASLPLPVMWLAFRRTKRLQALHREQLDLEKQLAQMQKMDSLGVMASGVAHELGNQLLPVVTLSELLKNSDDLAEQERRKVELIHSSALSSQKILSKILEFSNQTDPHDEKCRVRDVLDRTRDVLTHTCPAKIVLLWRYQLDDEDVCLSEESLQDILMNLVTNAFDSLEDREGIVNVDVQKIERPGDKQADGNDAGPQSWLLFEVKDTGSGIDASIRDKVFDPFFTTKQVGKGSGLGLSLVRNAVLAAGGEIELHAQSRQGTNVKFMLPACNFDCRSS